MASIESGTGTTMEFGIAAALEAADVGVWQWQIASGRVTWSATLERIHGIPEGSFPGTFEGYQRDIHPEDRDRVLATIERTVSDGRPHRLEYRIVRPDGSVRWLQARGRVIAGKDGAPERVVGVCQDVTEQRERDQDRAAEQAQHRLAAEALAERTRLGLLSRDIGLALTQPGELRDTLQRCAQTVVDHLGAAFARIWTLDATGHVLELQASAGLYTHLDGPHGRVPVGKFKIGLIAEERKPHLTNQVVGDPRVGDQAWARREGMVAFAGYPLLIGDALVGVLAMFARHTLSDADFEGLGTVANAMAVGIARARADADIRASEAQYRFLAEATPTQVWTANEAGVLEFANSQTHEYFGADVARLGADAQQTLVHPDDRVDVNARWAASLAGGTPLDLEVRLRRHDGEYRWHILRARPFRDLGGQVVKWFGTNTDVHEAKLTRLALAQRAEEMAATAAALRRSNQELDQFAYVASHDLKAPLRGIANLSQWIEEDLPRDAGDGLREHLRLLRTRVHRMEALIDGILEYSRAGRATGPPERVAVRRLVADVLELLNPPPHVRVDVAELPVITTERLPLQQVFLNLLGNAIKHGGTAPDARIDVGVRAGDGDLAFTVRDGGPGIDPAFHDRIWGIFQTLQPRDKVEGTGIGLALVKKIVEARGGRVWVESAEGAGATFGFTWPLQAAAERA